MASPINTTTMPGDNMNPDDIDAAAGQLTGVGANVATTSSSVATAWKTLKTGYHAPEQETLFGAIQPATTLAGDFNSDLGKVATALETFATDVRTIKASVAQIRKDAAKFLATIHHGKVTITTQVVENRAQLEMGESKTSNKDVDWNSDDSTVQQNNALIRRTNDQQEQLWAAERKCANAIRDIYGARHISAASQSNPHGYGVNDIPDNASNLPWGNTVDVKESCGDKVADGFFVDGIANGLGGLIGFHYTQESALTPEKMGFSWSTLGNTWKGLGELGTGLAFTPASQALALLPGPVGNWFNASNEAAIGLVPGLLGIDLFKHDPNKKWYDDWNSGAFDNWKNNPARTAGSLGFNVLTVLVPGPKGLGALTKTGEVAGVAEKAGEVGDAGRLADGLGDLSKVTGSGGDIGKLADPAGKTALGDLGKTTGELGDGLNGLDKTDINVPNISHDGVNVDHPNVSDHGAGNAPEARDPGHSGTGDAPGATGHEPGATGHEPGATGHDGTGHHGGHDGGSGHGGDGTKESPRRYEYSNPAESLHGTHEPTASQLDHIGPSKDYPAGSHDHLIARWHEYQGKWGWDRWRDTYIRNQGHHARGVAYEQAYADTKHLGADDWARNTSMKQETGVDRNYDFVSKKEHEAIELKSSDYLDPRQLVKDEKLIRAGWDVKYVFGEAPKQSTIDALAKIGAEYDVFYGDPVLVN